MRELTENETLVLEDILQNIDSGMLIGKYDAEHGKKEFMYGIKTAMDFFAYLISIEYGEEFSEKFLKNMLDSEKKN